MSERVVSLIDMDCFYVQVEQREKPELRGKPCAVVQYNAWKGGGIIAVSYEARAHGVTRNMRGDAAKTRCPDLVLCPVPCVRGKADLTKYRDASAEVLQVLAQFGGQLERASIDEAYLDLTEVVDREVSKLPTASELPSSFLVGHDGSSAEEWLQAALDDGPESVRLIRGAVLVERIRAAVEEQTQFRCSAGIAPNKVLAKLACGMHKPNRQTIVLPSAVEQLFNELPLKKLRHLGGKLGSALNEDLGVVTMGQLRDRFSERELVDHFGSKTGRWLFELARGRDTEPVVGRQVAKSIGCSKTFPGTNALDTRDKVAHWIQQLGEEVIERLEKDREVNNRIARNLVVIVAHQGHPKFVSATRTCALTRYDVQKITHDAMVLLRPFNSTAPGSEVWSPAVTYLGLTAGKFADLEQQDTPKIRDLFAKSSSSSASLPTGTTPETAVASSSAAVTPSRPLTYFERLGEVSQQPSTSSAALQEVQDSGHQSKKTFEEKNEPLRPSFFERRLARTQKPESATSKLKTGTDEVIEVGSDDVIEVGSDDVDAKIDEVKEVEPKIDGVIEAEPIIDGVVEAEPIIDGVIEAEQSLYSESDFMLCADCGANVLIFHMPEHADRHVAEQLHRDLQQEIREETQRRRSEEKRPTKRRGRPPGSAKMKRTKEDAAFSLDKFLR